MLSLYILFSIALAAAYAAVLLHCVQAWRRAPRWEVPAGWQPETRVSVVVPARNEAAHIRACLESVLAGRYPAELLEILVADDHSEDATADIVRQLAGTQAAGRIRLLQLAARGEPAFFGKKNAIEWAVAEARGVLIVTTDADCVAPPDWLRLLVSLYERRQPGAIVAPVAIHREHNILQRFQALDMAGMMGITGGGMALGWYTMGNGANLCYAKSVFEAAGGFAGSRELASGDDFFILQKIARRAPVDGTAGPCSAPVVFLKNELAAVQTEAPENLADFFQQRLRWGTKSPALPDWGAKMTLGLILLLCGSIVLNAVLIAAQVVAPWVLFVQLGLKALADYILLCELCVFFNRRALLHWFWPSFFMHTLYIAGTGFASLILSRFTWKGRRLR